MYDIIVIGAGPAGLTSGIYARRSNKKVLIFEANTYGGQIINTLDIENYPVEAHISGYDFATKLYNQTKDLGAEIIFEKVIKIEDLGSEKQVTTAKNTYKCKALIIATGAENRKLGVDRENDLIGKGVSYCATCDGAFYKNKDVAVVGGGNTALEDALYLSNIAAKVYVIHRRDEFNAEQLTINELKNKDNVEFILNSSVISLNGEDKLSSIDIKNKNDEVVNIKVFGLFIAVGRVPENQNFSSLIEMNDAGYIVAGEDCHTNVDGIFVAGDNRVKSLRQLVTATSDGAIAASEAIKYINKK